MSSVLQRIVFFACMVAAGRASGETASPEQPIKVAVDALAADARLKDCSTAYGGMKVWLALNTDKVDPALETASGSKPTPAAMNVRIEIRKALLKLLETVPLLVCNKDDEYGRRKTVTELLKLMGRVTALDEAGWKQVGKLDVKTIDTKIQAFLAVDDVLFARMDGGLYRSADKGATWTFSFPRTDAAGLAYVSKIGDQVIGYDWNHEDVYFEQPDGTWKKVARLKLKNTMGMQFVRDGSVLYLVAGMEIWRTTNGKKWTVIKPKLPKAALKIPDSNDSSWIESLVVGGKRMYITTAATGGVFGSVDGGKKWTSVRQATLPTRTCRLSGNADLSNLVHACEEASAFTSHDGKVWEADQRSLPAALFSTDTANFLWLPQGRVLGDATASGGARWFTVPYFKYRIDAVALMSDRSLVALSGTTLYSHPAVD